mmetsp:Transcript_31619/g.64371  ORF Transcript_31619/g.64371 Transcript_31619/m.64371 type:complete len:99 (-) Transcript_31619:323-619(-)
MVPGRPQISVNPHPTHMTADLVGKHFASASKHLGVIITVQMACTVSDVIRSDQMGLGSGICSKPATPAPLSEQSGGLLFTVQVREYGPFHSFIKHVER